MAQIMAQQQLGCTGASSWQLAKCRSPSGLSKEITPLPWSGRHHPVSLMGSKCTLTARASKDGARSLMQLPSHGRFLRGDTAFPGPRLGDHLRKGKLQGSTKVTAVLAERPTLESTSSEQGKVPYNWQTEWYPVYITEQMPRDRPMAFTLFDTPLVLFYDSQGKLSCVEDRCPHRAAKLSEGQVSEQLPL